MRKPDLNFGQLSWESTSGKEYAQFVALLKKMWSNADENLFPNRVAGIKSYLAQAWLARQTGISLPDFMKNSFRANLAFFDSGDLAGFCDEYDNLAMYILFDVDSYPQEVRQLYTSLLENGAINKHFIEAAIEFSATKLTQDVISKSEPKESKGGCNSLVFSCLFLFGFGIYLIFFS